MKNSFVDQLKQVGRSAQKFIVDAIPVGNAVILWSEEMEQETHEGTADMPDCIRYNGDGTQDAANIVRVEHVGENDCIVYAITREGGSEFMKFLHELSDEELVYLAEYIRSQLQLVS